MNIIDLINKKRKSEKLTEEEYSFIVDGYTNNKIEDYQMSALLMAITINGMDLEETIFLTKAMIESGSQNDLTNLGNVVDKHSTGGVGDKVTLILGPIIAALDIKFAKMSGRGLGHTGGTIDKLESIPGFNTSLTKEEFENQLKEIGIAITSQTDNIVPADKKIYALRDVTGTVYSIPLIAASIMSKKIASGASNIIIDIKVGDGALVFTKEDGEKLARIMIEIGKVYGRKVVCVLTNMGQPLGETVGNALEVKESIDTLQGKGPEDITELVVKLAAIILGMENEINAVDAISKVKEIIASGEAYQKFIELVEKQGGNLDELKIAEKVISVKSSKTGFITDINTLRLGELARDLGAGRIEKEDKINPTVGFKITKKEGEYVTENEELLKVYLDDKDVSINDLLSCFKIGPSLQDKQPLIIDIIDSL